MFKSTHHSRRYERKCEWLSFSEHSVYVIDQFVRLCLVKDGDAALNGSTYSDSETAVVSEAESSWYARQLGPHCTAEWHVLLHRTDWLVSTAVVVCYDTVEF